MIPPGRVPRLLLATFALAVALPAAALELALPTGAEPLASRTQAVAGFRIATGAFDGRVVPSRTVDGTLTEEIWRLPAEGDGGNPARLAALLRNQLLAQGYEIGFSCADNACGGFDFRFALPIAQGPEMYVDLGDFQYLAASRRGPSGPEDVALTLSRGGQAGYLHLARIAADGAEAAITMPLVPVTPAIASVNSGIIDLLLAQGHAVLEDLTFTTGASALSGNRYESLVALAAWLEQDASRRVALVGHTDASGSQDANTALSQARAEAVRRALIADHGTRAEQVSAAGVGFLSPRATNTTAAGREANRRVEVVLLSN